MLDFLTDKPSELLASRICGGNGARRFLIFLWYVPLVFADEHDDREFVEPRKSVDLDRDETLP